MKEILLLLAMIVSFSVGYCQTMTFDNGPTESGFTFDGWAGALGTIWVSNLVNPATVTKDAGTWNFISFGVGPFVGANAMQVTSNLGQTYDYSTDTLGLHILNWAGVTTITFARISGSGASADHDNFKYTISGPCENPDVPILGFLPEKICDGDDALLTISGNLNDATAWHIYTDSCAGTLIGSTITSIFQTAQLFSDVTFYIRGEDGAGCVDESMGSCAALNVPVYINDVTTSTSGFIITANATGANYQWIDCDNENIPIPGETYQSFTASESGNYAVTVSENACTDTSECVNITIIGTEEINDLGINIYPNPTSGNLNIELKQVYTNLTVDIKNLTGQTISSHSYTNTDKINLKIMGEPGVYFIEVTMDDGGQFISKIVKK